jgi:hypothetical protein
MYETTIEFTVRPKAFSLSDCCFVTQSSRSTTMESIIALRQNVLQLILLTFLTSAAAYLIVQLPAFLRKLQIYRKYCASHKRFSIEAGEGKYRWLEDPFSYSRNYWLCKHEAIKHVFSRAAM